jgi:hypothetical protein
MERSTADPNLPPLPPEDYRELVSALERWAERHPEPDRPIFGYADSEFVSPRELVIAVESRSDLGARFLEDVRLLLTRVPFSTYLQSIERSRAPWWSILWHRMLNLFRRPPRRNT